MDGGGRGWGKGEKTFNSPPITISLFLTFTAMKIKDGGHNFR